MVHVQIYFYTQPQAQTWRKYGDWPEDSGLKPQVLYSQDNDLPG